jgi:hypothetical protein
MRNQQLIALCLAVAVVAGTTLIPIASRKKRTDPTSRDVASLLVTCGGLALVIAAVAFASGD